MNSVSRNVNEGILLHPKSVLDLLLNMGVSSEVVDCLLSLFLFYMRFKHVVELFFFFYCLVIVLISSIFPRFRSLHPT